MDFGKKSFMKKIPSYCKHCKRLGHDITVCMFAHPELARKSNEKEKGKASTTQYVRKGDSSHPNEKSTSQNPTQKPRQNVSNSIQGDKNQTPSTPIVPEADSVDQQAPPPLKETVIPPPSKESEAVVEHNNLEG